MQIIVDSGATKSEFIALYHKKIYAHFDTLGINANYSSDKEIEDVYQYAQQILKDNLLQIKTITHYGAGCLRQENITRIKTIIQHYFPYTEVFVYSDLLVPCHALCRNSEGIVGILGTGAAVCHFDGNAIIKVAPSLGYLLGDEGSGIDLGKRFLKAYLSKHLSKKTNELFEKWSPIASTEIISHLYSLPSPRKYFASIAPFLSENQNNQEIKNICKEAFVHFFRNNRSYFPQNNFSWYLSGSIAFYFKEIIQEVAYEENIQLQTIIQKPLEKIIDLCLQ